MSLAGALRVREWQGAARRVIERHFLTQRGLGALLSVLRNSEVCDDVAGMASTLLAQEGSRCEAAEFVWNHQPRELLLREIGPYIGFLAILDEPEVHEFLYEEAFRTTHRSWYPSTSRSAIMGLREFDPESAFEAARAHILDGTASERPYFASLLVQIDARRASQFFAEFLAQQVDRVFVHAVGQALDDAEQISRIIEWLKVPTHELRVEAGRAAAAARWSEELDSALLRACRDRDWDVRDNAVLSLEAIRRERDVRALIEMLRSEPSRGRKWAILDCVLDLADPGVVSLGAKSWLTALSEHAPPSMKRSTYDFVKKKRMELKKKLGR